MMAKLFLTTTHLFLLSSSLNRILVASDEVEPTCAKETPEVSSCRENPTWRSADNSSETVPFDEKCRVAMDYDIDFDEVTDGPYASRRESKKESEMGVFDRPWVKQILSCMKLKKEVRESEMTPTTTTAEAEKEEIKKPNIAERYYSQIHDHPVMAVVDNALSEEEAVTVQILAECIKEIAPRQYEKRDFEYTKEGGGNDVTYLGGFLQIFAPGVAAQVLRVNRMVWEDLEWGKIPRADDIDKKVLGEPDEFPTELYPDPRLCSIRTSELLGYHEDTKSDYTVLFALAGPEDYEGGEYTLFTDDRYKYPERKVELKPNRLSAIVFLSEWTHGVQDIKTPGREMFTNEIWRYGEVPVGKMRPTPKDFLRLNKLGRQ